MSPLEELSKVLSNKNEPLIQRVKIAENALKSPEIKIPNLEIVLLKWIVNIELQNDNKSSWEICLRWLQTDLFSNINTIVLSHEQVTEFTNILTNKLRNSTEDQEMLEITLHVCVNVINVFQNYFKLNLFLYFEFLCAIVNLIKSEDLFLKFIMSERLFPRKLLSRHDFSQIFVSHFYNNLCKVVREDFNENELIFKECSKLLQKFVFDRKFHVFEEVLEVYCNENKKELSEVAKNYIVLFEGNQQEPMHQHLLFHAFCANYSKNYQACYKLFAILVANLGFSVQGELNLNIANEVTCTADQSIETLASFLKTLENLQFNSEYKLGKLTLDQCLQKLLLTVLHLTKDHQRKRSYYQLINSVIKISPLAIEHIVDQIFVYTICTNNENLQSLYVEVLMNIFEIFHKMHNIPYMISKFIRTLQPIYYNSENNEQNDHNIFIYLGKRLKSKYKVEQYLETNVEKTIAVELLKYFSYCLNTFTSPKIRNLYKTLIFHFGELVADNKLENLDGNQTAFLEILCTLTCQFLSNTRICEHTIVLSTVEKFYLVMLEHAEVLSKLGKSLVALEHNNKLVQIFLKLCYTWGELLIILKHYSAGEGKEFDIPLVKDSSNFCDFTYLHSYLNTETWCLISERIQNFGDASSKDLMLKMCLQKLRAILVFETIIDEEGLSSLTKNISNLEDYSKTLIDDKFSRGELISKLDSQTITKICELLVNDLIVDSKINGQLVENISNNAILLNEIVFVIFAKIDKLFKGKKKRNHDENNTSGKFTEIFTNIDDQIMENENYDCVGNISQVMFKNNSFNAEINLMKVQDLVNVLKELPLLYLSEFKRIVFLVFFCSLLADLKDLQGSCKLRLCEDLQDLVQGLLQYQLYSLHKIAKSDEFACFIFANFSKPTEIFDIYVSKCLKTYEGTRELKKCINYLKKNLDIAENVEFSLVLLQNVKKHKSVKDENTKHVIEGHRKNICNFLIEHLQTDNQRCHVKVLATILTIYATEDECEINTFKDILNSYLERILNLEIQEDKEGILLLLQTIYQHSHKFGKILKGKDEFAQRVWNFLKKSVDFQLYPHLVIHIFQNLDDLVSFENVTKEFLEISLKLMKNKVKFVDLLKAWTEISNCKIKTSKCEKWRNILQEFLFATFSECLSTNNHGHYDSVMRFECTILQNKQLLLSATILDIILSTVTMRMRSDNDFIDDFKSSMNIIETSLKHRQALISDRLPLLLQQYRTLVQYICKFGKTDLQKDVAHYGHVSDCAHMLEKLTINLCGLKQMSNMTIYLIADILQEYESITLYPSVKLHLNNCLINLIRISSQYGVNCLSRSLSAGSREIFKSVYENFKKYHRFTGRV